jgi:ferric-dicitrate binding protein FerR (iron transport regulator)
MTNQRLRFLFDRYVNQTSTEDEKAEFFQLISNAAQDPELSSMMDQLWNSVPEENVHVLLPDLVFENVLNTKRGNTGVRKTHRPGFAWLKVAAAIGFVSMSFAGLYFNLTPSSILAENSQQGQPKKTDSFIRLPDGSTVILNTGSALKYPPSFDGQQIREVYLEGEGFFDIKHDPSRPFIVHAGQVKTTVLGTAFNIKAFPNEAEVTVTVTRGKVEVSSDQKVLGVLTHDQQIKVNKKSDHTNVKEIDSRIATTWIERDLTFDDVTMEEAAQELENRFNVKIVLMNENIKACRFTATFVKGEDIEQILLVICEFNKVTFSYDNEENLIVVNGEGCR